jgi:hypothetical protein
MNARIIGIVLVCIGLILAGLILTGESIAKIDPATIEGMWLFDDGTGKAAKDSSGKGLDGDLKGSPKWVNGKFGKALEFDGKGAYVEIPAHKNPTKAITVSAWVKSNTPGWNTHGWMVSKRDAYIIHPNQGGTQVAFPLCNGGCWNQPGGWADGSIGPKDITEWHMYTGTFDSKTGDWKIYIDGKEESVLDLNKSPIAEDADVLWIGRDQCCDPRYGDALIDEVIIFNVALPVEDLETLAELGIEGALAVDPADKVSSTWADIKTKY